MQAPLPNRMAVYLTGFVALVAGLLPLVGNLDWTSTAGVLAALAAVAVVVREWLVNWGKWERGEGAGLLPGELEDDFDEEHAEPLPDDVIEAANRREPVAEHGGTTIAPPKGTPPA
jgi:hypothetical protein